MNDFTDGFSIDAVQAALRDFEINGWLMYDFRGSNVLACRVLNISEESLGTRRFFYFVPVEGEPVKLVHRIETDMLDHLPGEKQVYLRWETLEEKLQKIVSGTPTVAMEYSPRNANPYVSRVDAGTVELIRSFGCEVVSSGDLVQQFEATWSDRQWELHLEAARHTDAAFPLAWDFLAEEIRKNGSVEESAVCDRIMQHFAENNMTTYHPPIVGVGPNGGLPHYETGTGKITAIKQGDPLLIDLWAKIDDSDGVYSDLTRMAYVGEDVPEDFAKVFEIVAAGRDAAIDCVESAFAEGRVLQGWEVDQAARDVITEAGYGDAFRHRTGHSIGRETHGNGANMDNLETREERRVLKRTCFSIEPGIYLTEFGVRSEVNVYIDDAGEVHVTAGGCQKEVHRIMV